MAIFNETAVFQTRISQADRRLTAAESRAEAIETIRATARAICGSDGSVWCCARARFATM